MARGGINKALVQKAKTALLAQGKHPSIDAVRIALGNTGSKTTISHYLKELDDTPKHGALTVRERLSGPLSELVVALADQLTSDAEETVQHAQAKFAAAQEQLQNQLQTTKMDVDNQQEQARMLTVQLEYERCQRQQEADQLAQKAVDLFEAQAKIQELTTQLNEKQVQIETLTTHYDQTRDSLDHFRQASKDSRDELLRQHEQQVQHLTGELRRSNATVMSKQQELVDLNRDNAQLIEKLVTEQRANADQEKALRALTLRCRQLSSNHEQLIGQKHAITEQLAELKHTVHEKTEECEKLKAERLASQARPAAMRE